MYNSFFIIRTIKLDFVVFVFSFQVRNMGKAGLTEKAGGLAKKWIFML